VTRPWLIGEFNPYQAEGDYVDEFALYPDPPTSAGGRLCLRILRMTPEVYLATFERRNLLQRKWSMPKARAAAARIMEESGAAPLVLCGAKVSAAFGLEFKPFFAAEFQRGSEKKLLAIIPHPSGLNRAWQQPGSFRRAREVVESLLREPWGGIW